MTTADIIALLTDITTDKQQMIDALQDGQTLMSLGITDDDTEAVEGAYAIIFASLD